MIFKKEFEIDIKDNIDFSKLHTLGKFGIK